MIVLRDLRDATLQNIHLNWDPAVVRIEFKTAEPESEMVVVQAHGVVDFQCPRLQPNGPSCSVATTAIASTGEGYIMNIEMQNGESLRIDCKAVSMSPNN